MPSLTPKIASVVPAFDLREVFAGERTRPTTERVVKYIGHYYEQFSNRSEADRNSPYLLVEEFDLLMPTQTAYVNELMLCEGILKHSSGLMSDLDIKAILGAYVESHLWVYKAGVRSPKVGEDVWSDCQMVHVYEPGNLHLAFTCNAIQSWLVWLLHRDIELRVLRLN
jgi:hypothetical protein